jgi:integrase
MPKHSAVPIHKTEERQRLMPRREPYWAAPLDAGRYLGFRKLKDKPGSWIARARIERRDEPGLWEQKYRDLGSISDKLDYYAARKLAQVWFDELDEGVENDRPFTVEDACKEYVEELRREKRGQTADDAEYRFKRCGITGDVFGRIEVSKLRAPAIKNWRQELGVGEATQNRMMASLRAALNLAVKNSRVPATAAKYWRAVEQHRGVDGRRENFLTIEERNSLLDAAKGAARDLILAALLTGARPGELVGLKRSAFDARTKSVTFVSGKTKKRKGGKRTVQLVGPALELFERLGKSKLPNALLLTRDDGQPWTRIEWSRRIHQAVELAVVTDADGKKHKLPADTCLYDCRHTFISQALQDGMTTLDVATQTGTSLQMLQDHYGHIHADAMRERLAKVRML